MIPTLIIFGLVFGRWWRVTLVAAAIGWPLLLVASGTGATGLELFGAAGLALANTLVGVAVHRFVRWTAGRLRRCGSRPRLSQ